MFLFVTKMVKGILVIVSCVVLNIISAQSYDYVTSTPIIIENLPTSSSCYLKWEELLPALDIIRSRSNINKEKLLKIYQMIYYLLTGEKPKEHRVVLENIKEPDDNFKSCDIPYFESIVDERLKQIKNNLDGNTDISEHVVVDIKKDLSQSNTAKLYKILAKISAALEKVKDFNECDESSSSLDFTSVFRVNENLCDSLMQQPFFKNLGKEYKHSKLTEINSAFDAANFNIPYQRAADILEETSTFIIPKDAYCDISTNANLNSIPKRVKFNSDNFPFQMVPDSINCVDSDNSIAVLFKPKKVSMIQNCGSMLKKTSTNVLIPYRVAKLNI